MAKMKILSEVTGTAWKILVKQGQRVNEDDELMIAEAMKMEIPHVAPKAGIVKQICVQEGDLISEDDLIFVLEI